MATDRWGFLVAKVVKQGQGVSDCRQPDRKSKRTTMKKGGVVLGGGGQFSEAKLLLGWRGEKYHSNNSTRDERREGAGGDGEPVGML